MTEYRIIFTEKRGVNIEAENEEEARQIVIRREWEYGMDWDEGEIEVLHIEEF